MSYYGRRSSSDGDWWWHVLGCAFLVCALVAWLMDCSEKRDCRERGGRVEEYNCHTIFVPIPCGENCTTWVPQEECEWRCVE